MVTSHGLSPAITVACISPKNSVSLLAVYQILSESASTWSKAVHISIWFRWYFPFGSWQPPVSTLLCAMLTDPSTYCLLEGIKSFFDSMSILLNQHDKTLFPVRLWQCWLVMSALVILVLVAENIRSSIEYGLLKFIQSTGLLWKIIQNVSLS